MSDRPVKGGILALAQTIIEGNTSSAVQQLEKRLRQLMARVETVVRDLEALEARVEVLEP